MTPWAPTRLTSCIFHSGHTEAYEPLRSTRRPARAPFRDLAAPESTRKPALHTRGISRARSCDLEVIPCAPTRLTSCISHPGPDESSGASTSEPGPAKPPSASDFQHRARQSVSGPLLPIWRLLRRFRLAADIPHLEPHLLAACHRPVFPEFGAGQRLGTGWAVFCVKISLFFPSALAAASQRS